MICLVECGFYDTSITTGICLIVMQNFETFKDICDFFIQSALDPQYVTKIDRLLETPSANKDIVVLVKNVKAFHSMRKNLCSKIFKKLNNNSILVQLAKARGILQYKSVPHLSTCCISKIPLKEQNGVLLVIDGTKLITVHSRYKIILYHFWHIVHMPEEIANEAIKWLEKQPWWSTGKKSTISECSKRVLNYNAQVFTKSLYVKLKSIAEYVENELSDIPIS